MALYLMFVEAKKTAARVWTGSWGWFLSSPHHLFRQPHCNRSLKRFPLDFVCVRANCFRTVFINRSTTRHQHWPGNSAWNTIANHTKPVISIQNENKDNNLVSVSKMKKGGHYCSSPLLLCFRHLTQMTPKESIPAEGSWGKKIKCLALFLGSKRLKMTKMTSVSLSNKVLLHL